MYVANHVQTIRNATEPSQWRYINTSSNPADLATRCMSPSKLVESWWISGPDFLWIQLSQPPYLPQKMALNESDPEVKREVTACATKLHVSQELGFS